MFVQFEKTPVYCGPASNLYVLGTLFRGDSVEVYHQRKMDGVEFGSEREP